MTPEVEALHREIRELKADKQSAAEFVLAAYRCGQTCQNQKDALHFALRELTGYPLWLVDVVAGSVQPRNRRR